MKKFKNKRTGKIAIVSDNMAAGMCEHTMGGTFVIYKYEDETFQYSKIMEHREFNLKFE